MTDLLLSLASILQTDRQTSLSQARVARSHAALGPKETSLSADHRLFSTLSTGISDFNQQQHQNPVAMPPRKKAKTSPPQPEKQWTPAKTPTSNDSASKPEEEEFDPVADPWTDEQETALLKGIIRWKPVGELRLVRLSLLCGYG